MARAPCGSSRFTQAACRLVTSAALSRHGVDYTVKLLRRGACPRIDGWARFAVHKGDRHRAETHNAIHRNNLTRSQSPFVNSRMKYPG